MLNKFKYCPDCGHDKIELSQIDGQKREKCNNCGKVFYKNPIPSVVGISINDDKDGPDSGRTWLTREVVKESIRIGGAIVIAVLLAFFGLHSK